LLQHTHYAVSFSSNLPYVFLVLSATLPTLLCSWCCVSTSANNFGHHVRMRKAIVSAPRAVANTPYNLPMCSPSSLSLSLCLSFSSFLHDLLSFIERCLSLESSFLLLNHRLPSASVSPTWRQLQEDAQLRNHFHQARKMGILRKPERSEAPERAERVPLLHSRALFGKRSSHPPKRGRSNLKPRTAIPPFVFISQPHHIQAHTNYRRHHRRERQPAHPLSTAGERNKMSC
jgi:hypothetical protein